MGLILQLAHKTDKDKKKYLTVLCTVYNEIIIELEEAKSWTWTPTNFVKYLKNAKNVTHLNPFMYR